jgi:hypothetical protein
MADNSEPNNFIKFLLILVAIGMLVLIVSLIGSCFNAAFNNQERPADINYKITMDYDNGENFTYYVLDYTQLKDDDINTVSFDGYYYQVYDCEFFYKYHWEYNDGTITFKYFEGEIDKLTRR